MHVLVVFSPLTASCILCSEGLVNTLLKLSACSVPSSLPLDCMRLHPMIKLIYCQMLLQARIGLGNQGKVLPFLDNFSLSEAMSLITSAEFNPCALFFWSQAPNHIWPAFRHSLKLFTHQASRLHIFPCAMTFNLFIH